MSDTVLDYLISFDIIGAGVVWIVAGKNSAPCIAIGIILIAVRLNEFGPPSALPRERGIWTESR